MILPPATDGSQSVAIGETERIYGTKWTVIVTLRPGRSFIEERIRIYNPTETHPSLLFLELHGGAEHCRVSVSFTR